MDRAEVFIVSSIGQVKMIPELQFRSILIGGVIMTAKAFLAEKKPTSTIILLTPWDKEKGFPKDIILNQNAAEFLGSSLPHFPSPLAVLPQNMFKDMKDTKFEIDTIYFVSALYRFQSAKGEDRFGLPETSVTPL